MKQKLNILGLLVVVIMFFGMPFSRAGNTVQGPWAKGRPSIEKQFSAEYVPGELLVRFKYGTPQAEVESIHSALGVREIKRIEPLEVRLIKLPPGLSVEEAIVHYEMEPNVAYAEPNYIVRFTATPNDPAFDQLWGLHNTGQQVNGVTGTADADIDAPEAWDITTGSDNVIIAVTDSGVAYLHPEINPNIWENSAELNGAAGVDDDGNGYIDDIYGWDFWANDGNPEDYHTHGTHVAGTIAAGGNNGAAITGVNWNAKIMALRIGGMIGAVGDAAEAITYAVDNGAHIINASWGGYYFSQTNYDAISYANDHGVLFVAAAGNEANNNDANPSYPASYDLPNIIAVAATDQDDNLALFSNYGVTSVDVAAPGTNIYSTIPEFTYGAPVVLYTESFDPFPAAWIFFGTNDTWGFASGTGDGGTDCLEDSPGGNYLDNTSSVAGYGTPFASVKDNRYTLSFKLRADLQDGFDFMALVFSEDGNAWYPHFYLLDLGNYRTGSTGGVFTDDAFDLTALADLFSSFYFGFALLSDGSTTGDGVYIDNLQLYREPKNISSYSYEYYQGTSMAAPHVAGIAGLVKAQNPNYTHLEIRDAILNTVDGKASLSGLVVTGGRVNAFGAVTYSTEPQTGDFGRTDGSPERPCFIATAAYGSPYGNYIDLLRAFRDEYLMIHPIGKKWVTLYYRYSPPMAGFIADHPRMRKGVRLILLPFVALSAGMVQTTPIQKGLIFCFIVGFLLGMALLSRGREAEK